jgi:hypothetical protein
MIEHAALRMDRATAPVHNPNQYNTLPYGFDNPDAPVLDPIRPTIGGYAVVCRTYRGGRVLWFRVFKDFTDAVVHYRHSTYHSNVLSDDTVVDVNNLANDKPAPIPVPIPEPISDAPPRTHLLPEYVDGEWVVYTRSASRRIVGAAPFVRLDDAIAHYKFLTETD